MEPNLGAQRTTIMWYIYDHHRSTKDELIFFCVGRELGDEVVVDLSRISRLVSY
ncbi:predicted protein [Plenodomus lingam JN3]|uniref:Predicted protein n=1 Tax=Leptosphaeria maculans (strain JN3 / isolate v23.1.3 / race Av1-4-5-6-7-8) TaxID=985895 RepID=E4ZSS8_LEPMJ|nr:predicted protein [Plenodomus lingam JN3]CBX94516.1 predicted protein [Plenodomus lingam JN3]